MAYQYLFNGGNMASKLMDMDPKYKCDWCKSEVLNIKKIPLVFHGIVFKEVCHNVCESCYRNNQLKKLGIEDE